MSKNLMDMADEKGIDCNGSWVRIAFNEILGTIYHSEIKEEAEDKLIEAMASIIFEKLDIKENELDWQKIEDWHYKEAYNLISYDHYLDFDDAKKIISKSKISPHYDWEDISSSAMDISKINEKILDTFREYIEDYSRIKKEDLDELIRKNIYTDFRLKRVQND